ncbi:glycosyltransferase family protein [Sulfuritalea hydrogenivorans]|uniref:Glycosyl transferase family 28 C-terminal domain-containing protein n=1 Tax=Sulfuritalea hydrogenivorans sk43H TaxID=1223802 RepID=W0SHY4_9PROT|nr:hypothetical protein [Sulfuritalea hydrogenivorans]BAO31034.1 hypothetical protein SUTH_03261 [Sulfuritalea hydrogenivorans sk43H]
MHLLVDISAHGLGHLAQTAPVLDALHALAPGLRLTVRSALPRERLARRIAADFAHIEEARDFGFAMHNAVDIDLAASAQRYREFHADWSQRVIAEADWLRHHRIDALLSNVAYLPLAAAAQAGIAATGLSSLNWAELFARYFGGEPWAAEIHGQMLAAYNAGKGFLRVTPGLPMQDIPRRREIGPIAHIGRRDRTRVARLLNLKQGERWVLLAMGGMEFRLPVEDWPPISGLNWLVPGEWQIERDDVRSFDVAALHFSDLLASVDAVVTKPGYGTFVEAACGGIPILYLERDDWPETPHFAAWLATHGRAQVLTRERLLAGDFIAALQTLWRAPPPAVPQANGADEAARWLVRELGLA